MKTQEKDVDSYTLQTLHCGVYGGTNGSFIQQGVYLHRTQRDAITPGPFLIVFLSESVTFRKFTPRPYMQK